MDVLITDVTATVLSPYAKGHYYVGLDCEEVNVLSPDYLEKGFIFTHVEEMVYKVHSVVFMA